MIGLEVMFCLLVFLLDIDRVWEMIIFVGLLGVEVIGVSLIMKIVEVW